MEPSIEKQEAPSQEQDRNAKYKELYYQHVPKLVRQGVLEKIQNEEKISGDSRQVFASVLFADISGFTQLSSRLSAEELQMHINEYFTKLLGIVEENAGDVIKFCGDAVMIMWAVPLTAPEEVKAAAVLMSAVCALQMLEECGEYRRSRRDSCTNPSVYANNNSATTPTRHRLSVSRAATQASMLSVALTGTSDSSPVKNISPHRASLTAPMSPTNGTVELSLHCGISCGTVHCMTLGDTQRLEFLLSGEVVSQMGAAEACAKAGEVCLHPAAYERIRNKLGGDAVFPPAAPLLKYFPPEENMRNMASEKKSNDACVEEFGAVGPGCVDECHPLLLSEKATNNECPPQQSVADASNCIDPCTPPAESSASVLTSEKNHINLLPAAPSAYVLTGKLAEEFVPSPGKQRSRRSVRIAPVGTSTNSTTTISAGNLSERRPRRSGSIISFHLPSERIAEVPSTDLESPAPTEQVDENSAVMSDPDAAGRAAEIKAQQKYALHERGLFPTDESAAILDANMENTGFASSKVLSEDSAKYLAALAKELTGGPTPLMRTRNKISAEDVMPQAIHTEDSQPHERQISVTTSRHGSLLTFLRGSKVYSSTTPALNSGGDAAEIPERAKPTRHSVSTSPTRTKRGSVVLNATISAKEGPSTGNAVGIIVRAPSIRQSVHLGVQRHLSSLFATTRTSLGFISPLRSSVLVRNSSQGVSVSSTTAASSAHSLPDVIEGEKQVKEEEVIFKNRPRTRTASGSFDEPGASTNAKSSSPQLSSTSDELSTLLSIDDPAQPALSRKKMTVAKIKRKLHFGTDEHVRAVRALLEKSKLSQQKHTEDVRDFNSSDNSLSEREQAETKLICAPPGSNEAHELRLLQELRRFTHETAARAIDSNTISFLSELRDVAVVFMQILDLETEFASGLFHKPQRVLCIILKLLRQFGGSLRQFVVDDKGCVAIGCFGLSGSSNQNNCVQAVDFAVSVRTLLHTLGCRSAVGITLGRVYCGLVGAAGRCEYAVMGASVNLAARLMAACAKGLTLQEATSPHSHANLAHDPSVHVHRTTFPNTHHSGTPFNVRRGRSSDPAHLHEQSGVLVDAAVHELAQHQFLFQPQAPIAAKGYSEPVKVFAAVRKKAQNCACTAPVDATQEIALRPLSLKHQSHCQCACAETGVALSHTEASLEETKSSESICETSDLSVPLIERDKLASEVIQLLLRREASQSGAIDAATQRYPPNCVLIEGPTGVGCSRLLEHILTAITTPSASFATTKAGGGNSGRAHTLNVVKVQCDPTHQYVPYNLVRSLLFKAIGLPDDGSLTASFASTNSIDKLHEGDSSRFCFASQKIESWCAARVNVAVSLADAFKLCHPSLSLQEVLLFHHKVRVSTEKQGSAALHASQLAAYCTALCNTSMVCFLPLLNEVLGTNMRHSTTQLCCGTPLEKVLGQVSAEVLDLIVSVLLQVLVLRAFGCDVVSPAEPMSGFILAADELQHADAESVNLISNSLTCMTRLSSPHCDASIPHCGSFIATYCDNSTSPLSETVVTTTQTGVSAASLPATKPLRQPSILPVSTCDCVEDLFAPGVVGENTPTHEQLIKQLRSRAKVITVPRLSHEGVRTLVKHILGLRQWTWLVDNAHLALGTAARSTESADNSRVDQSTSNSLRGRTTRTTRTTSPRKPSIPVASPPRVPVRRGSSYFPATSPSERNERFLHTTDCVAEEVSMASHSDFVVPSTAFAATLNTSRNNRARPPPRGPSHEQAVVQLLHTLSQNGLPRCVIEIGTSLREAIATNAFVGIHRLPVVVRRNKLLLEVLDQLSGMEVVVLKAAAVIGVSFDIPSLRAALVGMEMHRCAETVVLCGALAKLTSVGLIRAAANGSNSNSNSNSSSSSAESIHHSSVYPVLQSGISVPASQANMGLFEFTEGATQLAVYELMLEAQRALAHGAIGAHFEQTYAPADEETRKSEQLEHLLRVTHHYRHSNNITKKIESLTRLAEQYVSLQDNSNAMGVYCELITVALGTSVEDLVLMCTDNELSALTVLYNIFLPRASAAHADDAVSRNEAAVNMRHQLFQDQVAVLDPSALNKRKSTRFWRNWVLWPKNRARSNTAQKILPELAALTTDASKQHGLVSSLQQDTADAQQLIDIRQQLSSLSLTELYVQRRWLLRALHSTTSSYSSVGNLLQSSSLHRTACTTSNIEVRGEVSAVGVSLLDVVGWVGKLVHLCSRTNQDEERMEYATLALHLTELAPIPSIPPCSANPLPQDTTGSGKSTHTLNTITTMYTPHALHHMHSMNTTHSAMSHSGPCNITPFMNAPVMMDAADQSEQSITNNECSTCPACHRKNTLAVDVCCGWWPSAHKANFSGPGTSAVETDMASPSPSDSAIITAAVNQAVSKHFPAALRQTSHYCALHKSAAAQDDSVLHALLHPSESPTSNSMCAVGSTVTLATHLLSTGQALAVTVLLEPLVITVEMSAHAIAAWSLLSLAFRALDDIDSTTVCVRQALQLYSKMVTDGRCEDFQPVKCEVLHMCASHMVAVGRYDMAVKQYDVCSELLLQTHGISCMDPQLEKCWCLLFGGELTLTQELLRQLRRSGGNYGCIGFPNSSNIELSEKVQELALLLNILQTDSTDLFSSTVLADYNNVDGSEGSDSHHHCMSVLRSFASIVDPNTSMQGVVRSLLSIKAQLAQDIPSALLPPANVPIVEWISQQMENEVSYASNTNDANNITFTSLQQLCATTHFTTLSCTVVFCISIFTNMKHYADRLTQNATNLTTIEHNQICEILVLIALSMIRCDSLTNHNVTTLRPLYVVLTVQFDLLLAMFYDLFCTTDLPSMYANTYHITLTYVMHLTQHIRLHSPLPVRKTSIFGANTVATLVQNTSRLSKQNALVDKTTMSSEQECSATVGSVSTQRSSGCAEGCGLTQQKIQLWKGVLAETRNITHINSNKSDTCVALIETFLNSGMNIPREIEMENSSGIVKSIKEPQLVSVNPVYKPFRTYVLSQIDALEM